MAIMVALPSLVLPSVSVDGAQITLFVCLLAGIFTFVEYFSTYPSIIEFRDAAPFNRMRYFMAALIVCVLTLLYAGMTHASTLIQWVTVAGVTMGELLDIPFSPVRLVLLAMPESVDLAMLYMIRDGAALSYAISLVGILAFYGLVRVYDWPARKGAFNVWVNLPLFDPTTGGDVVPRLRRDGQINIAIGILLPFLLPALAAIASSMFDLATLFKSQSYVWSLAAWSFLPASMIMRGIAMNRIAELIENKRQRAYAKAAAEQV